MSARWRIVLGFALSSVVFGQTYSPPAGIRPARRGSATSILPGGRILAPAGQQYPTAPGPAGLAVSASGKVLVSVNAGPPAASLTWLESDRNWEGRTFPLRDVAGPTGVVFAKEHMVFISEGRSGRVALFDLESGDRRSAFDLNRNGYHDSFTGDLALDTARNILYVADQGNSRVVAIDTRLGVIDAKPRGILASLALSGAPSALALSPDRKKLYVTEPASESVSVVDVSEPAAPAVEAMVHAKTGQSRIVATEGHVYVSNAADDSITVIDTAANRAATEIPLRIPGLEQLRGIAPAGLAYDAKTGWLLVAEAGINALAVIDTGTSTVLGHIPAGWGPTQVVIDRGTVYVANRRGQGAGPSAVIRSGSLQIVDQEEIEGSVSIYPLPALAELPGDTEVAMRAAGLAESVRTAPPFPPEIRHVVLIEKTSRAFDEILGDIRHAANGPAAGAPALARYGKHGDVNGRQQRLSLHDVNVTPNHHAIAERWTFSDNFYADTASASGSSVGDHLKRNGISFVTIDASEISKASSDTERARGVIREINDRYGGAGADLPQLLHIQLPNDRAGRPRPADGYPYEESFLVDGDNALGLILEFLSGTRWWGSMAVLVAEESVPGGVDHIDAHRSVLLCAGPWSKRNYVAHSNSSFAGLWKTVFGILHAPPLDLFEASAADLSDCFTTAADVSAYKAAAVDKRVFDPGEK